MKDFFKPEDFDDRDPGPGKAYMLTREESAQIANEKLNALIESWPVVYGKPLRPTNPDPEALKRYQWSENKISGDTHTARLAFIEEIIKVPCKHEPFFEEYGGGLRGPAQCIHCGVELQLTWSEKK